ncbi:MAG: VWA domain-containing protein, partial [Terracidiphilus sp.]
MTGFTQKIAALAALALGLPCAQPALAQDSSQVPSTPQSGFVLKTNSELVLTNVVARDARTGEVVRGLKQSDFRIYENGREQQVATFDFQSVDMAT